MADADPSNAGKRSPLASVAGWLGRRGPAAASPAAPATDMPWPQFEVMLRTYLNLHGYAVLARERGAADAAGVWQLYGDQGPALADCRHWRAGEVGLEAVRALHREVADRKAVAGLVVTAGVFSEQAQTYAKDKSVDLIDGLGLLRSLHAQAAAQGSARGSPQRVPPPQRAPHAAPPAMDDEPVHVGREHVSCPRCGSAMVLRELKSGRLAGQKFWGCTQYAETGCQGTRRLA